MQNIDPLNISLASVKVYYLEMHDCISSAKKFDNYLISSELSKPISADYYRSLYYGVGKTWHWLDRMVLPEQELEVQLNADTVSIYTIQVNGNLAGYAEFVITGDYVEILYFGLFPNYIGQGIGKYFLEWVVEKAWSFQPKWIQLNTCELDHPNALPVYLKAGFKVVREEIQKRKVLIK